MFCSVGCATGHGVPLLYVELIINSVSNLTVYPSTSQYNLVRFTVFKFSSMCIFR